MTRSAIDHRQADRLLDRLAPFGGEHDALVTLLAQASCAPVAAELGDEALALAAFRVAAADRAAGLPRAAPHHPVAPRHLAAWGLRRRAMAPGPMLGALAAVAASVAIGVLGYTASIGLASWTTDGSAQSDGSAQTGRPVTPDRASPATAAGSAVEVGGPADSGQGSASATGSHSGGPTPGRGERPPARPVPVVAAGSGPWPLDVPGQVGSGDVGSMDPGPPGRHVAGLNGGDRGGGPSLAPVPPPMTLPEASAPVLGPAPDSGSGATVAGVGPPEPVGDPGTRGAGGAVASPGPGSQAAPSAGGAALSREAIRASCAAWATRRDHPAPVGPDLTPLIILAGGEQRVPALCATLDPRPG